MVEVQKWTRYWNDDLQQWEDRRCSSSAPKVHTKESLLSLKATVRESKVASPAQIKLVEAVFDHIIETLQEPTGDK